MIPDFFARAHCRKRTILKNDLVKDLLAHWHEIVLFTQDESADCIFGGQAFYEESRRLLVQEWKVEAFRKAEHVNIRGGAGRLVVPSFPCACSVHVTEEDFNSFCRRYPVHLQ